MKALAFADTHGNEDTATQIIERAKAPFVDVVIGCGDFGLKTVAPILSAIDKPMVLVPGNAESYEDLLTAFAGKRDCAVLHGDSIVLNGQRFFGLGGSIPEFAGFGCDEAEAAFLLEGCPADAVLVTHSPPLGQCDKDRRGRRLGSAAIYAAVVHKQPKFNVCGHIHASWDAVSQVGLTPIYNVPPTGKIIFFP